MKKLIVILVMLIASISYGQSVSKTLTAGGTFDVVSLGEYFEIAVSDTGDADTVLVYYPITTIAGAVAYALVGTIKELATNNNVLGLYGSSANKVYMLWHPRPRAVRFVLSAYASGSVHITATWK